MNTSGAIIKRLLTVILAGVLLMVGCYRPAPGQSPTLTAPAGGPGTPALTGEPAPVEKQPGGPTATAVEQQETPTGEAPPAATGLEEPPPTAAAMPEGGEPLVWSEDEAMPALPAPPSVPVEAPETVMGEARRAVDAPELTGLLAVGSQVIDLATGEGWQVRQPAAWVDWSENGQFLLMEVGGEGGSTFALYRRDGTPVQELPFAERPHWEGENAILPAGVIRRAADGHEARLEYTPDMTWLLHTRAGSGAEWQAVPVEPQPTDRLYNLMDWVPGTNLVLAQRYVAGNAAMTTGAELVTIDALSGQVNPLGAAAPLGQTGGYAWKPGGDPVLGLVASGGGEGARRLAVVDFSTGDVRYPLPEGVMINDLAWTPSGDRLAVAVLETGAVTAPEAGQGIAGPGIYLVDPGTAVVEQVTQAPEGEVDGFANWTANGEVLLFARTATGEQGERTAGVFARRVADGQEFEVVSGVPIQDDRFGTVLWQQLFAYTP